MIDVRFSVSGPTTKLGAASKPISSAADRAVRLSAPDPALVHGPLRDAVAICLAAAFGSRDWLQTPLPIGDETDPYSAHGIIAGFGQRAATMLICTEPEDPSAAPAVMGCAIGSVLDERLIEAYGLSPYGAARRDGLLAYIGLTPSAQGRRAEPLGDGRYRMIAAERCGPTIGRREGISLARLLFLHWLRLPDIAACPHVFLRTRETIGAIRHLADVSGFRLCGKFALDFRGEPQERLVFKRVNADAQGSEAAWRWPEARHCAPIGIT